MTTVYSGFGTPASLTVASTLAAGNYDLTATVFNATTNKPVDVLVDYTATVAANSTGNKQIVLFVQASIDGSTWGALPTSATDSTHDSSMRLMGAIYTNGGASSESVRGHFSISSALGYLPPYWRVIIKNDCGVALSACSARTQEISITAA